MLATLTLPAGHELPAPHRAPTVRVRSANELQSALRHARQHAVTLDGSGLDRVLRVDAGRGLLELQAATPWAELVRYLAARKIALHAFSQLSSLPATIGGAVCVAAAGPDGLPVTAHVLAVTLVTPEGELRRADREANKELLRLVLGGQGVVGVLYSVTLSIESLRRSAENAVAPVEFGIAQTTCAAAAACAIECLLPPAELDGFLKDVRSLVDERRLALLGISVWRHLADGSCQLNWSTREWAGVQIRFGIKTTLGASVGAAEARRALLAAAIARGGSFALHHAQDATRRQLETCYPMLREFLTEKRRGDPGERLQNGWYRNVVAKLRGDSCQIRWGES
jgi:FAD/FMN-containing dehydrogenase